MVEVSKPPPEVTAKTSQSEISTGTKEKKSSKKSKEQRKSKTETNGITDGESDGTVTLYVPNGVAGAVTLNQMVTATSDLSATTPATLSGSHAGSPSALVIPDGVAGAVTLNLMV